MLSASLTKIFLFFIQFQNAVSFFHKLNQAITKRKEGNVLFNDTLNTFYLQLYGIRNMVKDHSDSERGNLLLPHRLLLPIGSKRYFICITHRQDNTYHSLCYTSCGALAGTRNSSMGYICLIMNSQYLCWGVIKTCIHSFIYSSLSYVLFQITKSRSYDTEFDILH